MRKGTETQRFPHSALLFRFCLRVLESRKKGTKVHDQEVGNILEYNPSDTSHWKRGKKAVRSVYALEALSQSLDVDLETIQDLADGQTELEEAWFDFAEAEEERRLTKEFTPGLAQDRRDRQMMLENVTLKLHAKASVSSVPVYLPEILQVLPFIQVAQGDVSDKLARSSRVKPGQYSIRYRKGELRAHTRLALAREISRVILYSEREQFQIPAKVDALSFFEIVDLSNALLVPKESLRAELPKLPSKANMVKTLADVFWVPKSVIRARLANLLLESANDSVFQSEPLSVRIMGAVRKITAADFAEDDTSAGAPASASEMPTGTTLMSAESIETAD